MKQTVKWLIFVPFFLLVFFVGLHAANQLVNLTRVDKAGAATSSTKTAATHAAGRQPAKTEQMTIAAVGDILIHSRVYNTVKTASGYDFQSIFRVIKKETRKPSMLTANQESILGGRKIGLSSYPTFNSPVEVGAAVKDAGVDIYSTANNHAMDRGVAGQLASLHNIDRLGIPHVGTYADRTDAEHIEVTATRGIRVAWLAYTFGTNGIPVPKDRRYMVNFSNQAKMRRDLQKARAKADVVVVSMHWGSEYQHNPNPQQKQLARFLADNGADIVFGSHPHVLQPLEWLKGAGGRHVLVVYSLGNFMSGQYYPYTNLGGMAQVRVTKTVRNRTAKVTLSAASFLPTYVAKRHGKYLVVPLKDAGHYGLKNAAQTYRGVMGHMTRKLGDK
ncbi:MAG: CapA family protein [Sporolactobacillus sp.]|jgi:poly-gamma-glutamate synthesis protein (capsule biosynthesis protein)|nr:CapA family protein [Sporolactobacillus sp.]